MALLVTLYTLTIVPVLANYENRNFLIVGDSYGTGTYWDSSTGSLKKLDTVWSTMFKKYIEDNGGKATILCVDGAGFSTSLENDLYGIINGTSNKTTYSDIIIGCGYNDGVRESELSLISEGINKVLVELNKNYDIKNLYLFAIGSHPSYSTNPFTNVYNTYSQIYNDVGNDCNVYYYSNTHECLNSNDFIDGVHPTLEGQAKLFCNIVDEID